MKPSKRLDRIPPYLFAELERKIAEKKAAGVDVISLGIGDPDRPTPALVVQAMQEAVSEPETHRTPPTAAAADFRGAVSDFYERRFDVKLDPETEIIPAIGAKEAIFNLNLAFLDPGDAALAADPGYPVYTGGPRARRRRRRPDAARSRERGFVPDLDAIAPADPARAKLVYLNYPNNPTGALAPEGFFERVVAFAREHDVLVVHDLSYSEIAYEGHRPPSFLATPGAKEVGVEVYSLSKGYNMTGWRCAAVVGNAQAVETYWRLKTNIDSGLFEAVQLAGVAALSPRRRRRGRLDERAVPHTPRPRVRRARAKAGVHVTPPKGTIYVWAPVPAGFESSVAYCEHVLERTAVVISPGSAYGPSGEGWFRISLTTPDERLAEAVERLASMS